MDYFKILNLNREPFSNSPEPEFFFQSMSHLACLQQVEIAIRLRRGLTVVMGEVGTGKTTLCRQLLLRFAETQEDRQEIESHLLLDPSFSSSREFLATIAASFGIPDAQSEWQMKEGVKNYLFQRGVDEKKTVLLIIDEGQKLPDFCREILREFLNYETNENKLLQIVIFAQNEFREILKGHRNFADRVNRTYFLGPLDFRETREMIRFRLAQAAHPAAGPKLFTLPALWAIYRATGGYPRRIITLCHHVLLAVIIRNRVRAGWLLVRSAARKLAPRAARPKRWGSTTAALAMALLLASLLLWYAPVPQSVVRQPPPRIQDVPLNAPAARSRPVDPAGAVQQASKPLPPVPPAKAAPAAPKPEAVLSGDGDPQKKIPARLGRLKVREGESIPLLLREIYGMGGAGHLQALARENPHIADIHRIPAGETVTFPAIPALPGPLGPEKVWVQMARKGALEEAFRIFRGYPSDLPPIRLVPSWNPREGFVFTIVLKKGFSNTGEALGAIEHLPTRAKIMEKPEPGTVFFAN